MKKNELEQNLGKAAENIKKDDSKRHNYIMIDLTSITFDEESNKEILQKTLGINFYDCYDMYKNRIKKNSYGKINLCDIEMFNLIDSCVPLLYFVNDITELSGNTLWCKLRDVTYDLVVDTNGSISTLLKL